MTKKELAVKVIALLKAEYPSAECSLNYSSPLQLLIATKLSAQCTDARVNKVTPELFSKYKTAEDFANAPTEDIEKIIHSCGFYRTKSREIIAMCTGILSKHGGNVPDTIENLVALPGIGRKTANLILVEVYNKPGLVVDTHFIRITSRLGFHDTKNAEKIEFLMAKLIPKNEMKDFGHRIVAHGRSVCKAINPKCNVCILNNICRFKKLFF